MLLLFSLIGKNYTFRLTFDSLGRRLRWIEQLHFATLFTGKKKKKKKLFLITPPKKTPVTEETENIKKWLDLVLKEGRGMKILHGQILNVLEEGRQVWGLNDQNVNRIEIIAK